MVDGTRTRDLLFGNEVKRKSAKLWKRVKLGLDHKEFQAIIEIMERENHQLEVLTQGNLELEPIRRERNRDTDKKNWKGIRECALRLYNCLTTKWTCQCGNLHQASLRLDPRPGSKTEIADVRFEIIFSFSNESIETRPNNEWKWKWRNTEIRPFDTR